MITAKEMDEAIHYLVDTDIELAKLEGKLRDAERVADVRKDIAYIRAKGANIREKEANANLDPEYNAAYDAVTPILVDFKTLLYSRRTKSEIIDIYRTQEASRRAGV